MVYKQSDISYVSSSIQNIFKTRLFNDTKDPQTLSSDNHFARQQQHKLRDVTRLCGASIAVYGT